MEKIYFYACRIELADGSVRIINGTKLMEAFERPAEAVFFMEEVRERLFELIKAQNPNINLNGAKAEFLALNPL